VAASIRWYSSRSYCVTRLGAIPDLPTRAVRPIALRDCVLEVQLHASCGSSHGLLYAGWAWDCDGDVKVAQNPVSSPLELGHANGHSVASIATRYDKLDRDRDCSEAMTRNMFKWLRDADGYPVAERSIRDWIDDDWSSGDESAAPEGDGLSTTDWRVGPWISRGVTT